MSTGECDHTDDCHCLIGVGADGGGEFVVMRCSECSKSWDEYREWSSGGSDET